MFDLTKKPLANGPDCNNLKTCISDDFHTSQRRIRCKVFVFFAFLLQDKSWKIAEGLAINDFSRAKMDATAAELVEERDTAISFLCV